MEGKVKGIFDIHVIDVYLTNARSSAWVFDTGSVANICNLKRRLWIKRRLANDEVTMRLGNGSKVDVIAVGMLPLHLATFGISFKPKYLLFGASVEHEHYIWILFDARRLFI